jgi:hypothetical protein
LRFPRWRSVALIGAGTLSLGGVAVGVALVGSAGHASPPAPSPSPSVDALIAGSPADDFADFRALRHQTAASAPIRRLPHVRLATVSVDGIPPVPLAAYHRAARKEALTRPTCHLQWWLLAGIGLVESGHAHSGGSTHAGWNGVARPPIYGPVLDGHHGYKAIPDTDGGVLDGDKRWDRAVGPMQFLPSTWRSWGPTGHLDGHANPQNIRAATVATAGYLCASGRDLSQQRALALAVYSYNHSFGYVRLVLSVGARYAGMTPDQLGVNLLPTDHPAKAHKHRRGRHRQSRTSPRGTQRSGSSVSPSPSPSASPSPSPSPSSSSQPIPNPLPTLSPLIR